MAIKQKLARRAAKTTAKHTAKGAASKLTRSPLRTTTLLLLGGVVGFALGRFARPSFAPTVQG
jgi:hypothetical protein